MESIVERIAREQSIDIKGIKKISEELSIFLLNNTDMSDIQLAKLLRIITKLKSELANE